MRAGYGFYVRTGIITAIDHSQRWVTGEVTLKLYKGQAYLTGRSSPYSLYSEKIVTFEDDHGAYDQKDAEGFIKLNGKLIPVSAAGTDRYTSGDLLVTTRLLDDEGNAGLQAQELIVVPPGAGDELGYRGYSICDQ